MTDRPFPLAQYVEGVVRLLDSIGYNDNNHTPDARRTALAAVYSATARFFADPGQQDIITKQVKQAKMDVAMRTSVMVTVYCWPKVREEVQIALSIYWVYIVILDDSPVGPDAEMDGFTADLLTGRQQQHPFWKLMAPFLEQRLLPIYGPFCSMTMLRGTLDYFQGCWIETRNFAGFKGSHYFPLFLRRMNALGGFSGASLFPRDVVDEQEHFEEVTTAIAEIEPMAAWYNDLFSFYKEWDQPHEATSLVNSVCKVECIGIDESFDRLIADTVHSSNRLLSVFRESASPEIEAIVNAFVQGYCTWSFCDVRYKMKEVYEQADTVPYGERFRQYYDHAMEVGSLDFEHWAPSGATFI